MTIPIKHFYMIRHGETEANAAEIMAGHSDTQLTPRGIEQARRARDVIGKLSEKPVIIYHSHLSRARDTAQIINEALDIPMIEDPNWSEMDVGEWSNQPRAITRPLFRSWQTPPGGETPQSFWGRIKTAHCRAMQETTSGIPLIVCHGGVMRGFGKLFNIDISKSNSFKNAHLYEFKPSQEKKDFPWDVWDYDLDEKGEELIKTVSTTYENE